MRLRPAAPHGNRDGENTQPKCPRSWNCDASIVRHNRQRGRAENKYQFVTAIHVAIQRRSDTLKLAVVDARELTLPVIPLYPAAKIFAGILEALEDQPSYKRALTLLRLGRCYRSGGRLDLAEATYQQGIAVTEQLDATDSAESDAVQRLRGPLRADLATALAEQGKYAEAREQYELALESITQVNDLRNEAAILGQLGTLAEREGNLADAVKRHHEALELFQRLGEPAMQAVAHRQLGIAFAQAAQWTKSEQHFRDSARLFEHQGNHAEASRDWNNLANVSVSAGKPEAAETWYRKAIDGGRQTGDTLPTARAVSNLAGLLLTQPGRLDEARELAEEALAIKQTLDPGAAQIWTTYEILADIADQQAHPDEAAEYRRLAREAKRNFAGTAHEMKRHLPLILGTLQAIQEPNTADEFRATLSRMEEDGWTNLVAAINRILAGERNSEPLCEQLDLEDSMIIETILDAIADPATLADLLPPEDAQ